MSHPNDKFEEMNENEEENEMKKFVLMYEEFYLFLEIKINWI